MIKVTNTCKNVLNYSVQEESNRVRVHLTVRAISAASHVNHPLVPVSLKVAKKLQLFLLNEHRK